MSLTYYVLAAGIAAIITLTLSLVILKLSLRYRLYPKIRDRDVHTRPTPRLGGVAMFIGILASFWVASQLPQFSLIFATNPGRVIAILVAAFIIVVIGVADDIWDLDWMTKLAGQAIAAGLLVWQGVQLLTVPIGGVTVLPPVLGLVITIVAVVLVMNAVNFIDGLDGLVAGVALISNGVFFIYTYVLTTQSAPSVYFNLASLISAVLIGACVGFLPLNWHPAKMFMGDAGALLVGLLMAASAVSVTGDVDPGAISSGSKLLPAFIPILLPLAVLVIPLLDFGLAVFRRLRAGKSPFSADRLHLHHRLLDMGHSHFHAVLIFYAWTSVVSVGFLAFLFVPVWTAVTFIVAGLVTCSVVTLAPLTRQKAVEYAVQSASIANIEEIGAARFDPLDARGLDGSNDAERTIESVTAQDVVLGALARKEKS